MTTTKSSFQSRSPVNKVRGTHDAWRLSACPVESDDTIHGLIAEYQRSGCTASRDRVVCSYLRLIASLAHRCARSRVPVDDLMVEGSLCVLQAMTTFDPSRGVPFGGYVSTILHRRIRAAAGELSIESSGVDGGVSLGLHEQMSEQADDRTAPPSQRVERKDDAVRLHAAVEELPPLWAALVSKRFGLNGEEAHSVDDLSACLGLSPRETRRLLDRALTSLRVRFTTPDHEPEPERCAA